VTKVTAVPARDRAFILADGRTVAFSEWGDMGGEPVVLLHGQPGSRLLCPDLEATEAAGVRLITMDRSGWGRSDPRLDPTVLGWVDDFAALAEHLELPPCPVIGWSAGGPYALACAYRLPDRVSVVGLAAAVAPLDEVPAVTDGLPPEWRARRELLRRDRAAGIAAIADASRWFDGDGWESLFAEPWRPAADERYRADPRVVAELKAWQREGARQGSLGYAADDVAEALPAGFTVADVRQDVHVWIGEADQLPRIHADHFVSTLPRATLVAYPGEGHMFALAHWGEMLAALG
jgi:pimeloyl-ACP methyl ester carboxylesterase